MCLDILSLGITRVYKSIIYSTLLREFPCYEVIRISCLKCVDNIGMFLFRGGDVLSNTVK